MKAKVPNLLSLSRVGLALAILPSIALEAPSLIVTLTVGTALALITDWADGYLARRWEVASELGYVLDAMGDRAFHLALTLIVLVRYSVPPILVWLLVFRDISIYAVRLLSADWLNRSRGIQWISRFHATNLRIWLASFFLAEASPLLGGPEILVYAWYKHAQLALISATIIFSYWGLARAFSWLDERRIE